MRLRANLDEAADEAGVFTTYRSQTWEVFIRNTQHLLSSLAGCLECHLLLRTIKTLRKVNKSLSHDRHRAGQNTPSTVAWRGQTRPLGL